MRSSAEQEDEDGKLPERETYRLLQKNGERKGEEGAWVEVGAGGGFSILWTYHCKTNDLYEMVGISTAQENGKEG